MYQRVHTICVSLLLVAIVSGCGSTPAHAWRRVLAGCDDPGNVAMREMVYVGPSREGVGVGSLWRATEGRFELVAPAPPGLPDDAVEVVRSGVCERDPVDLVNPKTPSQLVLSRLGGPADLRAALDRASRVAIAVDGWRELALVAEPFEAWLESLPPGDAYRNAHAAAGVEVVTRAVEVDGLRSTLHLDGGRAAEIVSSFGATVSSSRLEEVGVRLELELSDWDTLEMVAPEPTVIAIEPATRDSAVATETPAFDAPLGVLDPERQARTLAFSFATESGYVFDGRIHLPAEEGRNGWGVLMIGGGIANDLDWTVPGHLEMDGERQQVTITGESHADAPRLAKALTERGFVVGHWSTIRRDDPNANWPYTVTTYPLPQMVLHAQTALSAFRAQRFFDADRTILLGYSMGAHRACILADDYQDIAGLVLLAPAQLTRTGSGEAGGNTHRSAALVLLVAMDEGADGAVSRAEFDAWRASGDKTRVMGDSFDAIDFDADGVLRAWELLAARSRDSRRRIKPEDAPMDGAGLPWSEDILRRIDVPTLVLSGALDDAQGHHAPIMLELIEEHGLEHVTLQVLPDIGHSMGPEVEGRIGPIDDAVLQRIGQWLDERLTPTASRRPVRP